MRRIFTILAVVLMAGTFTFAQTAPQTETKEPKAKSEHAKPAPKATSAKGVITKADASSVTLKTKAGEESFAINADTKITQSGKAITASDLKADETATVSYTKTGETMTATKIVVAAPAKAKGEKKQPVEKK